MTRSWLVPIRHFQPAPIKSHILNLFVKQKSEQAIQYHRILFVAGIGLYEKIIESDIMPKPMATQEHHIDNIVNANSTNYSIS